MNLKGVLDRQHKLIGYSVLSQEAVMKGNQVFINDDNQCGSFRPVFTFLFLIVERS